MRFLFRDTIYNIVNAKGGNRLFQYDYLQN